jgi:hypothetical protein
VQRSEIARPLLFFELMKAMSDSWKHKAVISECEVSQKKFTGLKKE